MSERQTLTYLQQHFKKARLQPLTRFGQNFLIDLNLVQLIADSAELNRRDVVLEVGTGLGSLTTMMAGRAGHVVTVEIDHNLAPMARHEFESLENVTLLEQDALKGKNRLHPMVIQTLQQQISQIQGGRLKLVANLPYNVATPIISNLLDIEPWPSRIVVTIQRELAERICAKPCTKDYSALSVWIQSQCQASIVRTMSPNVFWPKPKVESAIIDVRPERVLRDRIPDRAFFHDLTRKIFLHRRKFLRSALHSAVKELLTKPQVDEVLAEMELAANARAEELSPQQFIELTEMVRKAVGSRL
ncbi:MAG TPA: ribosomal RNA small subunit methyltransferase A [Planctomycetaceae bacterium]|nr:ribosomal RNA small subunit methyltransferase A [Planctomycetaceae bacterium]